MGSTVSSERQGWLRPYARYIFLSPDFIVAVIAGLGVFVAGLLVDEVHQAARQVLIATFVASAGLLGLVMTAQATLTREIDTDNHYREVIERAGGWDLATMPYTVTAKVSGATAIWSLLAWVVLAALPRVLGILALSIAILGTVWVLGACVQVQALTNWHGKQRHQLQRIKDRARIAIERRRNSE